VIAPLPSTTFFVIGPTAVGKSDIAAAFAERVNGEIVGADAFQVYAGLDILGAKPSAETRARVPHHLIGEIPLAMSFDVAQYRAMAVARIAEIAARGRVPVVCGGAGFYIRALTHGLAETPPRDPALRGELEKESLDSLVTRLRKLDPDVEVDFKNPRRVMRALEVCLLSGRPFSSFRAEWEENPPVRGAVLNISRERLHDRIAARTAAMFDRGVVEEVASAGEVGPTASQMLGLHEVREHLAGHLAREECQSRIVQATRQYAKRQLTWFRRERGYRWLDVDALADPVDELLRVAARP
jgi:tRNA dimethylallyltransferase